MTAASMPEFDSAPTFDEVMEYAVRNDMYGKISITKFYDYYKPFTGPGGYIIDWKTKMWEWAEKQKSKVVVSAKEYEAYNRITKGKPKEKKPVIDSVSALWDKVAQI